MNPILSPIPSPGFKPSVYVAASSSEIPRTKKMMAALREKGIEVISTWAKNIEKVGESNPRNASIEDRQKWSLDDIQRSCRATIFWLLMPKGPNSFGATFEFAFFTALADTKLQAAFVSGDYLRSIFTSFAACFSTDEEALEEIVSLCESVTVPDCTCGAKPEQIDGAPEGVMVTPHQNFCAYTQWMFKHNEPTTPASSTPASSPENENAAQPEG